GKVKYYCQHFRRYILLCLTKNQDIFNKSRIIKRERERERERERLTQGPKSGKAMRSFQKATKANCSD
ncbi:MAG: hypothetical protein KTM48_03460, partial [Wolbachia endosymbiont of Pissodes strobi]|nr:hypothetical protein [Wolbachia endosymbiont of Pissodes strobi]